MVSHSHVVVWTCHGYTYLEQPPPPSSLMWWWWCGAAYLLWCFYKLLRPHLKRLKTSSADLWARNANGNWSGNNMLCMFCKEDLLGVYFDILFKVLNYFSSIYWNGSVCFWKAKKKKEKAITRPNSVSITSEWTPIPSHLLHDVFAASCWFTEKDWELRVQTKIFYFCWIM